ncbi:MAG TPA: hypothetical protein VFY93_03850 [Planctomycetota bacterium]|nr:hypothetical protein [Planctomycetota bacterium]
MTALCLLLLFAPGAEETSYADIERLFRTETPAPEPPAGLRAPANSPRHERAREEYREAVARWHEKEDARRRTIEEACTRHLSQYPEGEHRLDVLYLRGVNRYRDGRFEDARADLAKYLEQAPETAVASAARVALVESCRALGDFAAALSYGGPDPDLLEEAGKITEAIAAAEAKGDAERAARWALIGKPFPEPIPIPEGVVAVILAGGKSLPKERESRLREQFSAEKRNVAFLSAPGPYPAALYLLDSQGVVRAVDPRPDSIEHRVRRLARRG